MDGKYYFDIKKCIHSSNTSVAITNMYKKYLHLVALLGTSTTDTMIYDAF